MTPCLKNALYYAHQNWVLFPALYDKISKRHKGLVKWSLNASSDPEQIKRWAEKFPRAYFCVALKQSNLTVIDVDNKHGKRGSEELARLVEAHGPLPKTVMSATPSGGRHYIFEKFTRFTTGVLANGIDTPVMIPLPGSDVPGKGAYKLISNGKPAPIPTWLVERLGRQKERSKDHDTPAVEEDQPEHIIQAVEYALNAPPSIEGEYGDNQIYLTACSIRDFGVSSSVCLSILEKYFNPRCQPPWDPQELETKVNNVYNYARTRAGENTAQAEFSEPKAPAALKDAGDITIRTIRAPRWVLGDRLIKEFTTVTVAPGGTGKSALAIMEALAVASDQDLTGTGVSCPGAVWLYNTEDPEDELERRILAAAIAHGIKLNKLPHSLKYTSSRNRPLVLVEDDRRRGFIINQETINFMIGHIRKHKIVAMIVDPFVRTHKVSENDNRAIDLVVAQFDRVAQETQCAVSLFHHTKKGTNGAGDISGSRGASALVDAARIAHTLTPMSTQEGEGYGLPGLRHKWYARLDNAKANLSPPGGNTLWFEKISVDLFDDSNKTVVALKRSDPRSDMERSDQRAIIAAVKDLIPEEGECGIRDLARKMKEEERHLLSDKHEETIARVIMKCLAEPMDIGKRRIWYEEQKDNGGGKRTKRVVCSKLV